MRQRIIESVTVALLLAILGAAVSTWVEVKMLRRDVDRLDVYVNELWEESRKR